jgi:hypothetical protein
MEETPRHRRSLLDAVGYELRRKSTPLERWLILPVALFEFGVLIGLHALGINVLPTAAHETGGEAGAIGAASVAVLISLVRLTAYLVERWRTRPH